MVPSKSPTNVAKIVPLAPKRIRSRCHLAYLHFVSAVHLAKLTEEVEERGDTAKQIEHRAYATGAIILSVAFLEATANELFCDAVDGELPSEYSKGETMAKLWRLGVVDAAPILKKYQFALALSGRGLFDPGCDPYQSVYAVIRLRNALMHFQPQWVDEGAEKPQKMDSLLKGRFDPGPWHPDIGPLFPHGCFSYGCAKWAIPSCVQLVDEFLERMDHELDGWWPADRVRMQQDLESL